LAERKHILYLHVCLMVVPFLSNHSAMSSHKTPQWGRFHWQCIYF